MTITIANNNINSSGTLTLNNRALSDVAFTGDYDDLVNKPNIGSGGMLVDSWTENTEWYRTYDDGFIEQGGYMSATNRTVSFNKQFANRCMSICCQLDNASGGANGFAQIYNVTTSSFFIRARTNGSTYYDPGYWYACGY